ncbi:RNA polymerase sigma factor, sigma-70 family [Singulisphaera sp. GP187]|uniref:sigma-70 family RNA polymerase sigma factor n=1 Tax=Singulisphaera sp. GP187 TaxID=1882752 RepID=UPI00092AB1EB|nr:sigma-70 family RNA polymerase sigma factor [Singulisphaera sp. GP187]SIO31081.1 RNA polymerase sigma factor, sigma-70 family [Singulisphaera sp. GP187]
MGESTDGIILKHLQTLYSVGAIGGLSDSELGERVVAGRDDTAEAAFTCLAERHGPMVLRVCRQMLHDRHEAEDAFQATFLVLASKAHAIRNQDSVAGWLHGVARRVALRSKADATRRRIKERQAAIVAAAHSPEDNQGQSESWPELHEEIARLPERYREPVVLCYLEGLTTEAAAQRLGCPQGTILSRLSRAKERLRRSLTRRGVAVPAGVLAAEWGSDVALAVPAALLETTVRASLNFTARQAAGAALASTTAVGLARGVLYAMTLSQWKTFGAATLACVLAMGSLRAFAQFGGIGGTDEAPAVKPVADDRQAALTRSVAKIQTELDEANRRNAELQKQLQAIQAELKTLQANPTPASTKEAKPNQAATATPIRLPAEGFGMNAHTGFALQGGSNQYKHHTFKNSVIVVSPLGDKIKIYNTRTNKTQSLQLSASKEFPLEVIPIASPGAGALRLKGSNIIRIAASRSLDGKWITQDLREPVNGVVSPLGGTDIVVYLLGRYAYGFSPKLQRWDVVELPNGTKGSPLAAIGMASIEGDGHVYTFDNDTGKWSDVDLRAIIDAPDDNQPNDAEPNPAASESTPRATTP